LLDGLAVLRALDRSAPSSSLGSACPARLPPSSHTGAASRAMRTSRSSTAGAEEAASSSSSLPTGVTPKLDREAAPELPPCRATVSLPPSTSPPAWPSKLRPSLLPAKTTLHATVVPPSSENLVLPLLSPPSPKMRWAIGCLLEAFASLYSACRQPKMGLDAIVGDSLSRNLQFFSITTPEWTGERSSTLVIGQWKAGCAVNKGGSIFV
jgi:hypothetical protein